MKIETKELPKSELLISVELTPEELTAYENQTAAQISEKVEVPGFRKGQAPKAFVISQVGPEVFEQEVINTALNKSYFEAITSKNLYIISRPLITLQEKKPLKYEAKVAILPKIEMAGYEGIKIPLGNTDVSEKEMNDVIDEMRKYKATYTPVTEAIQKGDKVEIDFEGFDEGGAAVDKTKSSNHPLFVGEGSLIDGFEEQLIGMKVGDKKQFPLTFPKDFREKSLQGKKVVFHVEVKKAERPNLPEITESFIKEIMGVEKTPSEFKDIVKEDVKRRKLSEAREHQQNMLIDKFLGLAKFEVPPLLVEEEIDAMLERLRADMEKNNYPFDKYMEQMVEQKRDLRKEYSERAETNIRIRLVLDHLFKAMNIQVTPEDMTGAMNMVMQATPEANRAPLNEQFNKKGEIYHRLHYNLMLDKLFRNFLEV